MVEGEFLAEAAARVERDAELLLAAGKDGFQLRIALQVLGHVAHCGARGLAARHVTGLILSLAGLVELLPAFHKAVGAPVRIGADFGLYLQGANGAVYPA